MALTSIRIVLIAATGLLCLGAAANGHAKPTAGHTPVSRRVGRLVAAGRCDQALSLALSTGNPHLAQRVLRHCGSGPAATATDSAPAAIIPGGPPPPEGPGEAQIQAWVTVYVKPDGWSLGDRDAQGVHLITGDGAQLTPRGTLRVFGREELFQPAERAGLVGRSDRQEFEVDCAGKRVRLLSMQVFRDNNLAGPSQQIPGPLTDWIAGRGGTHTAAQIGQLCHVGLHASPAAGLGQTPAR